MHSLSDGPMTILHVHLSCQLCNTLSIEKTYLDKFSKAKIMVAVLFVSPGVGQGLYQHHVLLKKLVVAMT
jgi:hypothetical protein